MLAHNLGWPSSRWQACYYSQTHTLLKVTSMHRSCTWHSQTWQLPVATLKKMRKPLSKAPRANISSPSLTETGLYAHFQTKYWLREWTSHQLLPLSWKLDGVFWGHCYMEECIHLEKNQILLARKKLGVGEVWGSIWWMQPTVSDQITHDSDVYWISSHPSLTYFISSANKAVRG